MTISLPDRLRADADRNTVSGDSGFSNEVMRDLQYTAELEREAAHKIEDLAKLKQVVGEWKQRAEAAERQLHGLAEDCGELERQLAEAKAEMREQCAEVCIAMRPTGGRAWTTEQTACWEALSDAAKNIRDLQLDPKEPA